MEWMHYVLVLLDVHFVVFDEDDCALVVVFTAVVRRAKDRDHRRERLVTTPPVHLVSINLDLMRPNHRNEIVCAEDLLDRFEAKLDGALALGVRAEFHLARVTVVHRVRPEQIAQEALQGRFNETIDIFNICLV